MTNFVTVGRLKNYQHGCQGERNNGKNANTEFVFFCSRIKLSRCTFLFLSLPFLFILLSSKTLVIVAFAGKKLLEMIYTIYHAFIHAERFGPGRKRKKTKMQTFFKLKQPKQVRSTLYYTKE